ncbi:PFK5, partial [Symbiodinium necroappetens]
MEVVVENASGIPEGSILSIRAGNVRRQGTLSTDKPVQFAQTSLLDACPFKVDIFAPLGSSRLVLRPKNDRYTVSFGDSEKKMSLDLLVQGLSAAGPDKPQLTAPREELLSDTEAYLERHELQRFIQNLITSVLADKPDDPYAYMAHHLSNARVKEIPRPPSVQAAQSHTKRPAKKPARLAPHKKSFGHPAFVVEDFDGNLLTLRELEARDIIAPGAELRRLIIDDLGKVFTSKCLPSPLNEIVGHLIPNDARATQAIQLGSNDCFYQMPLAGPRPTLHFDPEEVVATLVTCGGLCPGLNAVIRELVMMLAQYGVRKIYGIRGGYKGVVKPETWMELTPDNVQDINSMGGTILVSDRGNPTEEEQVQVLMDMGVRAHFIIGGDGTHRGAFDCAQLVKAKGWNCSVIGIPKTIDNDIPMLDCTFGFDTACMEAERAIKAGYVEATCNANCIGLVKLMGRHSGFIALHACLAARNADIVLLPEMQICLEKVLQHCLELMQSKGHCVIVVAEGCGDTLLKSSGEVDGGGNKKLADVGPWLRDKLLERFKQVKLPLTVKYIDPTYMIRAIGPNANDSVYCSSLSHNAVHAAMAGYTGITVGQISSRQVLLPIACVTKNPQKRVDLKGQRFQELVSSTLQPNLAPEGAEEGVDQAPIPAENPLLHDSEPVELVGAIGEGCEVRRLELEHLSLKFGDQSEPTTLMQQVKGGKVCFFDEASWVTQTLGLPGVRLQMLKAGPRKKLYFKPSEVAATIVTCGGLCPGLNSVIRELVMMLYAYGVKKVYGIKGGFKGVVNPQSWVTLTPENVKDIHLQGGSILVSDRGNPAHIEMAKALKKRGVRQHFVLGGDGTQKGAYQTYEQMQSIGWECAVVGIPKTIDNDINLLDRSFGFDTAMTEAQKAIEVAYVEATCNANAIGLVKLMGRHCGYLTMMSVLAARHVDICLLPEMDINLEKVLDHCVELVSTSGYAVVVVAEGCGDTLLHSSGAIDEGGNKKINDVGPWLKDAITSHFKTLKLPITIKYVDPTYMVRAVPANPNDSIYCSELAQAAVHAAMAGYTGATVGKVDQQVVYLPIKMLTSMPSRVVDINGRWFEALRTTTQQPNLEWVGNAAAKPIDPTKKQGLQGLLRSRRAGPHTWTRGKSIDDLEKSDTLRVPDTTLTIMDGFGRVRESRPLARDDLIQDSTELRSLQCFNLSERYGTFDIPSTLKGVRLFSDNFSWTSQALFLGNRLDSGRGVPYFKMTRAGPREFLHFDPHDPASAAAIISCGGICPGLNCVIREIVNTLWAYGVRRIYGIKGGYKGLLEPDTWLELNPEVVKDIHTEGGTMLVSDRGNPPHLDMARALQSKNVRQYFVLGGDGTHKGAMQTFNGMMEIDHECAVVGVPKTIDNDVPMVDQTFGFDTACTEAAKAVNSAYVEARGNANCIGLVKLMGRHCGFIAMNAALAARNVDICLIPEMDIDLEKVLNHTEHLMRTKGHAVIVVAEGCGDTLIQSSGATDAGGNKILADVGPWLKDTITARFKSLGLPLTIKYIDPTYMIRSVPANSFDSTYCSVLGQMAVHGAMAGYSGITVGKIYERYCYLPIHAITNQKGKRVNPNGRWFFRMRESTKQPDFRPDIPSAPPKSAGTQDVLQAVSLLVGCLHYVEVSGYNCITTGLSVAEQKEAFLKTENAFYYSYYEEFVIAPDLGSALGSSLYDRRSEAPDTINALKRFNVYQEVICGALYRLAVWLCGRHNVVDPWYFFRSCSYVLQGLGHVGLLRLAAALGGDGVLGGLVP